MIYSLKKLGSRSFDQIKCAIGDKLYGDRQDQESQNLIQSSHKFTMVGRGGNSWRSIIMMLDGLSPEEVIALELATGVPIADILMADVLRLVDRFDGLAVYPACCDYVARATARPSFVKAHAAFFCGRLSNTRLFSKKCLVSSNHLIRYLI
jgi:hypothetical protein